MTLNQNLLSHRRMQSQFLISIDSTRIIVALLYYYGFYLIVTIVALLFYICFFTCICLVVYHMIEEKKSTYLSHSMENLWTPCLKCLHCQRDCLAEYIFTVLYFFISYSITSSIIFLTILGRCQRCNFKNHSINIVYCQA